MMRKKPALLVACLAMGLGTAVVAPEAAAGTVHAQAVSSTFCQTPDYASYFKISVTGQVTPGGGPLCYTGKGTATLNQQNVVQINSGSHSGHFTYRFPPSNAVRTFTFTAHQTASFNRAEILTLTLN